MMTPYRDHGRGTPRLDLKFPRPIGRIRRASGTDDPGIFEEMKTMLRTLYRNGRLEVLELVRDGKLSPIHCLDVYRSLIAESSDAEKVAFPTAADFLPLESTVRTWIKHKFCSDAHRESLQRSWDALLAQARGDASIIDTPGLVKRYRAKLEGKHHRTFNLAKAAAQAFVRDQLGHTSSVYGALSEIDILEVRRKRGHPCTIDEAREVADRLGSKAGSMWWTMCMTGMGKTEYLYRKWEVRRDHLYIPGTKREGRDRIVPLITMPVRPELTYAGFNSARRRAGVKQTLYDARRTYAHLLEEAGIPRSRRHAYLGHKTRDVLDLYEDFDVRKYVVQDAQRLRDSIGDLGRLRLIR